MVKRRLAALLHTDGQRRSLTRIACCSAAEVGSAATRC